MTWRCGKGRGGGGAGQGRAAQGCLVCAGLCSSVGSVQGAQRGQGDMGTRGGDGTYDSPCARMMCPCPLSHGPRDMSNCPRPILCLELTEAMHTHCHSHNLISGHNKRTPWSPPLCSDAACCVSCRATVQAMLGRAKVHEVRRNLGAALSALTEVAVRFTWFMPALVEKARLLLAVGDWDQVCVRCVWGVCVWGVRVCWV